MITTLAKIHEEINKISPKDINRKHCVLAKMLHHNETDWNKAVEEICSEQTKRTLDILEVFQEKHSVGN